MTLMNGLIHEGRALLWTDTAMYCPTSGKRLGKVGKFFWGTAWPWAAAHSGLINPQDPTRIGRLIAENAPSTGEELLVAATDALRIEAADGRPGGRLLLAYPCEEYGARMFLIAADGMPFAKPYEPYETIEYMSSGNGEAWAAEYTGKDLTLGMMRCFIDLQIEHPAETVLGFTGHTIGREIIQIEVTSKGVDWGVLRKIKQPRRRAP